MRILSFQKTADALKENRIRKWEWVLYGLYAIQFILAPFMWIQFGAHSAFMTGQKALWVSFALVQQLIILFGPYLLLKNTYALGKYLKEWVAFAPPVTFSFILIAIPLIFFGAFFTLAFNDVFPHIPEEVVAEAFLGITGTIFITYLFVKAFTKWK